MFHAKGMALWLAVVIAGCVMYTGLGSSRLWDRDEPRNAGCTVEMLAAGDWIVPVFNRELRTHKPVLLYWVQMLSYQIWGANEWGARFGSATLAIGSVIGLYGISRRLQSHKLNDSSPSSSQAKREAERSAWSDAPFWSAIVLSSCLMFVVAGRAATPDAPLIFFSLLGIVAMVFATTASQPSERWLYFAAAYIAWGFSVLSKGPVGVILPLAVVGLWRLLIAENTAVPSDSSQGWKAFLGWLGRFSPLSIWRESLRLQIPLGLVVVLLVALPWYIAVGWKTDGVWLREFFVEHNVQRAMETMEGHRGNVLFYPLASLVGTFPWSIWLVPAVIWGYRNVQNGSLERASILLGVSWVAIYIVAFSLASTKLPSYITPCYPGMGLIYGGFLASLARNEVLMRGMQRWLTWSALAILLMIGVAFAIFIPNLAAKENLPAVAWQGVWGVPLLVSAIGSMVLLVRHQHRWIPAMVAPGAVLFMVGLMAGGAGAVSAYRQDLDLIVATAKEMPDHRWVAYGVLEPSWVFYTGRPVKEIVVKDVDAANVAPLSTAWEKQLQETLADQCATCLVTSERLLPQVERVLKRSSDSQKVADSLSYDGAATDQGKSASIMDGEITMCEIIVREIARVDYFLQGEKLVLLEVRFPQSLSVPGAGDRREPELAAPLEPKSNDSAPSTWR